MCDYSSGDGRDMEPAHLVNDSVLWINQDNEEKMFHKLLLAMDPGDLVDIREETSQVIYWFPMLKCCS